MRSARIPSGQVSALMLDFGCHHTNQPGSGATLPAPPGKRLRARRQMTVGDYGSGVLQGVLPIKRLLGQQSGQTVPVIATTDLHRFGWRGR